MLGTPPAEPPPERRSARRNRGRQAGSAPCASGSRRIARTRRATVVTASSTRSASRSRTSTPSAVGATATAKPAGADRLLGRAGRRHAARRPDRRCARAARAARAVRADVHREAHDVRPRPRARATRTCRRCARSCATRPQRTTGSRHRAWHRDSDQFRRKALRRMHRQLSVRAPRRRR